MGPDSPLDDPKGDVARQPLWKRRVPTPVLLAVIIAGILAFSALWLPAHRGISKAECDKLSPGHVWYNGKCNVQVGNPNTFYIPDGGP